MSFLYTPEYLVEVFRMSRRACSLTNKFFNNGEITLKKGTNPEFKQAECPERLFFLIPATIP